jgi:hypothetical protein
MRVLSSEETKRVSGAGGGGGGSSTSTPTIAEEFKPLAKLYTTQAEQLAATPWRAYQGDRYADLNTSQNLGIGMVQNRALGGSQTMNNAEGALNQMIDGGQTNPYLDSLVGKAQRSVADNFNYMTKPQLETSMVNSGSFGNSGLQQRMDLQRKAAADQMGDIASSMYGNAYETDQSRRMQAVQLAPTYGDQAYKDAGQLLNVGGVQQQNTQNNLDFGYDQYKDAQNDPFKKLQTIGGVIGQNMGQTTTQTSGGK